MSASDNGTFTDLNDDIESSTGQLDVSKDYTYNDTGDGEYKNGVSIKENLTINGNNHKIDGNNLARVLNITAPKVVIRDLSFMNCNCEDFGGAIHSNSSILILENVKFINNKVTSTFTFKAESVLNSSSGGGAIFTNNTNLEIINCSFINNYVNASHYINGSSEEYETGDYMICRSEIYVYGGFDIRGGAIYALGGNINITDSNFKDNYVNCSFYTFEGTIGINPYGPGGGCIYSDKAKINIVNSNFTNSTVNIKCTIFPMIVGGILSYSKGGCIFIENNNITLVNCNFNNNSNGAYPGGAVYIGGYGDIINSTFSYNLGGIGGGIYSENTTNIYGSTFIENRAVGGSTLYHRGGAVYSMEDLFIVNSTFSNNSKYEINAYGNITLINTKYLFDTYIFTEDLIKYYNTNKSLIIQLVDESSKCLENQKITIQIGQKTYTRTTDKNGIAKLNINLLPKTYTAKIIFNSTERYNKSSETVKIIIKKSNLKLSSQSKTYKLKSVKKLTARLKDNNGKNLKGKLITFTVKGKKYKAYTKSNGIATVSVKLYKKGKFNVNIQYAGDKYYNKIKKTIKLTVK